MMTIKLAPILLAACLLTGCVNSIADRMTTGPNAGLSPDQVRALAETLGPQVPDTALTHNLRVPVDARGTDAAAELNVWVIDPTDQVIELNEQGNALRVVRPATGNTVEPRGTVVLLHGLWHHKGRRVYVLWARLFAAHGYRCVLIDHRAHGLSTGSRISYGVHEAQDTRQVIDALEKQNLVAGPLMLMGGSMGAATAIQTAAHDDRVDSVVALVPYSSLDEAIESVAESAFITANLMPDCFWDDYALAVCERNAMDIAQTDNAAAASRASAPMLIIAAEKDSLVPPRHAKTIYKVAAEGSRLFMLKGEDHRSIARGAPDPLVPLILGWLDQRQAARAVE